MKRPALHPTLALLLLVALGCEAKHEHDDEAEGKDVHEHAQDDDDHEGGHDKPAGPAVLRVDRNLLRDLRVTTRAAESRPAGDSVTALGELRVNEDAYAEVGVSLPARVDKVLAAPGDAVKPGQALVELDSPDIGRARAQLQMSAARLELARKAEARRSALASDQIVSQRELEATRAELAEAEAEQRAAQQSVLALGSARGSGSRFVLSSPIAGTVIERNALRGRMVDGSKPLFIIGDLQTLWLVVHAFERDALRMHSARTARTTFPALPGRAFEGKVTRLSSQVDPTSRTIDVRIEIDNPSGELRPGMSGSALVPLGDLRGAVVAVPVEALQRLEQGWCVFLPRPQPGEFEVRPVGRGRELGAEVEVVSGLARARRSSSTARSCSRPRPTSRAAAATSTTTEARHDRTHHPRLLRTAAAHCDLRARGSARRRARLSRAARDVFPDLSAPVFNVIVQNAAMGAEELEAAIAMPLETALAGLPGTRRIRSSTSSASRRSRSSSSPTLTTSARASSSPSACSSSPRSCPRAPSRRCCRA